MKPTATLCLIFIAGLLFASETERFSTFRLDLSEADLARVERITRPVSDFTKAEAFENMQGGAGTSRKFANRDSFSHFPSNLSFEERQKFALGNALFRKVWVGSPSSTHASDGLGPLFNARSCQSCHLKDGRGHPPGPDPDATSMFLRLALARAPNEDRPEVGGTGWPVRPDPVYGSQLQDKALPGLEAEGAMRITYEEFAFELAGGEKIMLRKPRYEAVKLTRGKLHPRTTISPRIAPPMIGLGLIQAIHPADLLRNADHEDADGNGISGRIALAVESESGETVIGLFGWKAQNPTLKEQAAKAFAGDIGISTDLVPKHFGDCTSAQKECLRMPTGVQKKLGDAEAPDPIPELVTFYSANLAVPARRDAEKPDVLKGKALFYRSGCASCHVPKYVTRRDAEIPAHRFQLIWPYSDFLLHDMGEGLADGQEVGSANGSEWRTPPLWGIGLTETVSGHTFFLHDGRARNLTEAILWHGGEAEKAKRAFAEMNKKNRRFLLNFLKSL